MSLQESKIKFNPDKKFDIQLSDALINERRLAHIFEHCDIHKIELKSETWQWEQTGNICIEYACEGKPSGIKVTEATCWVHELKRDDGTIVYLMFPVDRLKHLCRVHYQLGHYRHGAGDGGRYSVILIPLADILS